MINLRSTIIRAEPAEISVISAGFIFCCILESEIRNEEEKNMKKLFDKKNKKRIIICYSKAEMERLHDSYVERGIKAEELICAIPFSTVNVYKLIVEECA